MVLLKPENTEASTSALGPWPGDWHRRGARGRLAGLLACAATLAHTLRWRDPMPSFQAFRALGMQPLSHSQARPGRGAVLHLATYLAMSQSADEKMIMSGS